MTPTPLAEPEVFTVEFQKLRNKQNKWRMSGKWNPFLGESLDETPLLSEWPVIVLGSLQTLGQFGFLNIYVSSLRRRSPYLSTS